MFDGIKKMLLKKVIASKMKGMPESEIDRVLNIIDKNPDLFKQMGEEIEKLKKNGMSEMAASMQVARKYQSELAKLNQPNK